MKKSLLLATMAALGLSAAAQGVDPAAYQTKDGFTLTNLWLMDHGNGENGVAINDWLALPFGNIGKATTAAILDGKVYIACSQSYVDSTDENGNPIQTLEHIGHLIVLDAATGKFERQLDLTLNGAPYEALLCANMIGHDDFGHLWVCGYVQPTYDESDGVATVKPIKPYIVDVETGALTLAGSLALDEIEGPGNGARTDCYDLIGDITGKEARCVFMACPNEIAKTYTWHLEQGETEWETGVDSDNDYIVVQVMDTDPTGQTAWNYSPMVTIVPDDEFSGQLYYVDGHTTRPALYDHEGEMIENLAEHLDDEAWADFIPDRQPNGIRQFSLAGQDFVGYAMKFPDDSNMGGNISLVKLDENGSLENATPMWTFPEAGLGLKKGEGRFHHSISVTPIITDANGKQAIDIMIFKDANGVGVYRLAEEGFSADGIESAIVDSENAPVEYFNLNGVSVDRSNLAPGLYISRQGSKVEKVIIK